MRRIFQSHYMFVFGGLAVGIVGGVLFLDTSPPILGWLFAAGTGLTGGAFFAAILGGHQLISGPSPGALDLADMDYDAIEREMPSMFSDIPPREEDIVSVQDRNN